MTQDSRVVRVDEDIYKALQRLAKPFEDTPSTVIRRLIETLEAFGAPANEHSTNNRLAGRTRPNAIRSPERTPQASFRRPILETLIELGGRGEVEQVLTRVHEKMKRQLSEFDHSEISTGEQRWRVYARWERKNMELEGLLKGPRGSWEITEKGRAMLSQAG